MLATMDFEQLTSDVVGLTKMAQASQDRLAMISVRIASVRAKLQTLLDEAETPAGADAAADES